MENPVQQPRLAKGRTFMEAERRDRRNGTCDGTVVNGEPLSEMGIGQGFSHLSTKE